VEGKRGSVGNEGERREERGEWILSGKKESELM